MEISDLFDAHRRDAALLALSDEDLVVAAAAVTQLPPSCPLQTQWLAMDLAGFIAHTDSTASAVVIATQALKAITPRALFDAMATMSGYREPPRELRRAPVSASSRKLDLITAQPAFAAVLGQVCKREIERLTTGQTKQGDTDLLATLFPFITDPDDIAPLLHADNFFQHEHYMQRLWDLDAKHLVFNTATDEAAPWYARSAAVAFLKNTAALSEPC
jgi:hypothetical protein